MRAQIPQTPRIPPWQQQHSSRVFDERAEEYDSWFEDSLLFAIEKAAIQSLDIPSSRYSLEVGVGPGRFAQSLNISLGIDPAFAPLSLAKKRGIIGCQAIAEDLPCSTSSLDAVFLFFTLCFLESPARFLGECRRVLRPEASLVIGFVPAGSSWGRHLRKKKEAGHPFYQAANFFSIAQVQQLLASHDFQIYKSASTLYQPPENLTGFEPAKSGLDEQAGFVVIAAR